MTNSTLTLLTPSPPPPPTLRGSSHFSYLVPYHRPVCRFAHGHTGVFHNNFLWYKLLALIYIINPFSVIPAGIAFSHILRNTSLPKNVLFLCRTTIWEILFPLFYYYIYLLISPCQLLISKEQNAPVTLLGHNPWFYKGKGDGWWLATTAYDSPTGPFQLQTFKIIQNLHLLEVVVVRRKKLLGRFQQVSTTSAVPVGTFTVSLIPVVYLDLRISPQILKKFEMVLIIFSGAWRKMIQKKTWSKKSRDTVPFNQNISAHKNALISLNKTL